MIRGCFRHIRGIGPRTAAALNDSGIHSWDDCLSREHALPFGENRRKTFIEQVRASIAALGSNDIGFFTSAFPSVEQWRVLAHYFHAATFIDVETTGLSWSYCHASVISALHRGSVRSFVYGENMDDFLDLADDAELLVTFNGNCFDIPFLEKTFNIPSLGRPHIDLRWVAWHCGFRGGLKAIEKTLGISRPAGVEGIDGFEAVDLFFRWQAGETAARDLLVRYCETDVLATRLVAERLLLRNGCAIECTDPAELFSLSR